MKKKRLDFQVLLSVILGVLLFWGYPLGSR
jgi:hypothetical protein